MSGNSAGRWLAAAPERRQYRFQVATAPGGVGCDFTKRSDDGSDNPAAGNVAQALRRFSVGAEVDWRRRRRISAPGLEDEFLWYRSRRFLCARAAGPAGDCGDVARPALHDA